jgi:hypothetical protein
MYSDREVERKIKEYYDRTGVMLQHYDNGQLDDMIEHFNNLVKKFDKDGRPDGGIEGGLTRPLTQSEINWINNERQLCQFDFKYFALRYCNIKLADVAGEAVKFGRMNKFMLTQEILLAKMAKIEDQMMAEWQAGEPVNGIWMLIHKARQTGFTAIGRMMNYHRTSFFPDTLSLSASINEDMVHELYDRDQIIYSRMPWFLKPAIEFNVKDAQFTFKPFNSGTLYQQSNQKAGMGTGRTVSTVHLTECALWESAGGAPGKIEFSLLPGIPRAVNTWVMLESTAEGIGGYWYDAVMACVKGRDNLFNLLFCPWYAADEKYRAKPPEGWNPLPITVDMAETVARTSEEYTGKQVILNKYQAYFWEKTFLFHKSRKMLSQFYMNYPTTLTEAFISDSSAFSAETMAELSRGLGSIVGAYDLRSF